MEIALAHVDSTDKLPDGPEQFYYQAGGYVLLRIVRDGDTFAVMTATASEERPYKPYVFEPPSDRPPLFANPDGSPAFPAGPAPEPLHPRVFPDTDRLLAAAAPVPRPPSPPGPGVLRPLGAALPGRARRHRRLPDPGRRQRPGDRARA